MGKTLLLNQKYALFSGASCVSIIWWHHYPQGDILETPLVKTTLVCCHFSHDYDSNGGEVRDTVCFQNSDYNIVEQTQQKA